jgi:hypothetical protein
MSGGKEMKKVLWFTSVAVLISFMTVTLSAGPALAAAHAAKEKAKTKVVVGVLQETDGEYTIKSGKTVYTVSGQDLAPMKGKKVKVTGTVTKGAKGNVLEVTKIAEVKRKGK